MRILKFVESFFVEKALSFGGSSSLTIFRSVASFLIEMVEKLTDLDPLLKCMVLDGNCTVGRKDVDRDLFYEIQRGSRDPCC